MAHAKLGAKIQKDFSAGPAGVPGLQVIQLPPGTDVQSAIREYESNPDVLYAEPDYEVSIPPDEIGPILPDPDTAQISSVPNDANFSVLWGLHNTGQTGGTPDADIDAPEARDISTGSDSVIVAVIDTGVLYTHSDLSSNIWSNTDEFPDNGIDDDQNGFIDDIRGWDFVNSDNNPTDDNGHGTHCAGTIGATGNNGIGVAGVNWHVKIMPVKTNGALGSGSFTDLTEGVIYAGNNGAQVISMSVTGTASYLPLEDAILASPAVVVCAAGNQGTDNDISPHYPASFPSANIIAVAATNSTDDLVTVSTVSSWGSNYGAASVDLAAPGQEILSTFFDGNYAWGGGTSMATPHVSGVAALIKSINPQLTNIQIKNIILNNVDVTPSLSGKVLTSGRLNAYRAVLAAIPLPPVANFTASPLTGTAPLTGQFTDLSTNTPVTWNWTFGDGDITNSTDRNPVHTYSHFGRYNVSLTAGNAAGSNTTTRFNYIIVSNRSTHVGSYTRGVWHLDSNGNGVYDAGTDAAAIFGGSPGDMPVAGSRDGSGIGKAGIYRNGNWYVDWNGNGAWDATDASHVGVFGGISGDIPVTGTWDGTSASKAGIYRNGNWYVDWNGNGAWDATDATHIWTFGGLPGDIPVTGTWDGTSVSKAGIYRNGNWYVDWNGNGAWDATDASHVWVFGGLPGDTPGTGDWDGSGISKAGIYRNGNWYVDWNGNGAWDTTDAANTKGPFGTAGDTPVTGKW